MSSNKVTGLCAPATAPQQRKVKGYIFKSKDKHYPYFLGYTLGATAVKSEAYVYTREEAAKHMSAAEGWASKDDGKWLLVYE